MEESIALYFISKLDYIRLIFMLSTMISGFFLFACLLITWTDTFDHPPRFVLLLMIIIFLGSVMMDIFIPDTEEGLALYRKTYQIPPKEK